MTGTLRPTFMIRLCLAAAGLSLALAASAADSVFQQRPLAKFLDANNWIALPIPDSKMGPGAVVKVTKSGATVEARWLGDFRRCGVTDKDMGVVKGKFPALGVGEDFSVKASFAASLLERLGLRAEAEKVNGAVLKIDEAGGDAIDLLALKIWLEMPANKKNFPAACNDFLAQDDVYLVSEAFRISKGSYELIDKNGAKLSLNAAVAGKSIDADFSGSIGSNGALAVAGDFYFGVRRVKRLASGGFATLGQNEQEIPEADEMLRALPQ